MWGKILSVAAPKQTFKEGISNDKESVLDYCVGSSTSGRESEENAEEVWLSLVDMYDVTPMFMEKVPQPDIWNLVSILSCK